MIELSPIEYERVMAYDEAILYCFSLNIDGKVGWRLPTLNELKAELNVRDFWYKSDGEEFIDIDKWQFWVRPVRDLT